MDLCDDIQRKVLWYFKAGKLLQYVNNPFAFPEHLTKMCNNWIMVKYEKWD